MPWFSLGCEYHCPDQTGPGVFYALVLRHKLDTRQEVQPMSERETGTVKWFDERKGYGFIDRDNGDDIFVHYSQIAGAGFRNLQEGDRVEFSVGQGRKGPAAEDVHKI
jgi:CspA family cold shock protein